MSTFDVGDIATVDTELRDAAGTLAAGTVSIVVTAPDGTVLAPAPAVVDNGGVGKYRASFPLTATGTWAYQWTSAGAVTAVDGGQITVLGSGRLAAAAAYIRAPVADPLLPTLLLAAVRMVDGYLGAEGLLACPAEVRELAINQLTSELFSRSNNPGGVVWAPGGDTVTRLSRDAMVSVLPLLAPYTAGVGIA